MKTRIAFIDIGRGLAALLVFYSHLAEQWVAKREVGPTPVVDFVDGLTSDPMHMGLQGIGQVAVPFFFLVSGYVVTPVALRQGARGFGLNRLVRVYVPMTFVVLLTAGVILLGVDSLAGSKEPIVTWWTVITNALVINYLMVPQIVLVGVAWTLVVEIIFYMLLIALLPVLRRMPWMAISIQLVFIFVVMMSARQFGASWFLFAVNVSYLVIPLIGQIIWATTTKQVPLWLGGVFVGLAWSLYVLAEHRDFGRGDTSYNLALAFAVLCFLMGMFAEPRLVERRIWVGLSERSYSIYLLHGVVGFAVLDLLRPAVPLFAAMPIAVAVTFGVVELSYRYVEKPSHVLARRLARRAAPKPAPEPVEPEAEVDAELEAEVEAAMGPDVDPDLEPSDDDWDDSWDDEQDDDLDDAPSPQRPTAGEETTTAIPVIRAALPQPRPTGPQPRPTGPQPRPTASQPRPNAPQPRSDVPPPRTRRPMPLPPPPPQPAPARTPAPAPPPPPEELTQHIPVVNDEDEPNGTEPPRRRRRLEDSGTAVTVASLLADHARERNPHHP
ncbi:acyltransferase family protein [Saccharothrix deserti]|uniref:acyltransferase family protein n=1 Tax=Saccharothrix deserti TaxID=2593674 RepID=UPI001EE42DB1|nr:acyltransferase [Saccharothrix deserti]